MVNILIYYPQFGMHDGWCQSTSIPCACQKVLLWGYFEAFTSQSISISRKSISSVGAYGGRLCVWWHFTAISYHTNSDQCPISTCIMYIEMSAGEDTFRITGLCEVNLWQCCRALMWPLLLAWKCRWTSNGVFDDLRRLDAHVTIM